MIFHFNILLQNASLELTVANDLFEPVEFLFDLFARANYFVPGPAEVSHGFEKFEKKKTGVLIMEHCCKSATALT